MNLTLKFPAMLMGVTLMLSAAALTVSCSKDVQAFSPQQLEQQYGVTGAYSDTVKTADGTIVGTVVPVTLADGTKAQLIVPRDRRSEPHAVYLSDAQGIHPLQIQDRATRAEVVRSPSVVARRAETAHPQQRSWEKEALIIGGSAGAGAGVGALVGGKKGAGIGAAAGGIGGLIYDLTTRKK
jgi:hypothetical protein